LKGGCGSWLNKLIQSSVLFTTNFSYNWVMIQPTWMLNAKNVIRINLLSQIEMLPLAKYIASKIVPDVAESLMQYRFCNQTKRYPWWCNLTNEISFCWYIFQQHSLRGYSSASHLSFFFQFATSVLLRLWRDGLWDWLVWEIRDKIQQAYGISWASVGLSKPHSNKQCA